MTFIPAVDTDNWADAKVAAVSITVSIINLDSVFISLGSLSFWVMLLLYCPYCV
jgi:hypothetical protein